MLVGLVSGVAVTVCAAVLVGQSASQPVKSEPQYFVTSEGDNAHLWVREGVTLRAVGHGQCAKCPWDHEAGHDHKEGDGHDHKHDAPGK
jgi:ABC-type nickel/cobalt efflux system permease component RcnA